MDFEFIDNAVNEQIKIEEDTYGLVVNTYDYEASINENIGINLYPHMRTTSKIANQVINNLINVDEVIIQEYWIRFAIKFPMKSTFYRIPKKYRCPEIELLYKLN